MLWCDGPYRACFVLILLNESLSLFSKKKIVIHIHQLRTKDMCTPLNRNRGKHLKSSLSLMNHNIRVRENPFMNQGIPPKPNLTKNLKMDLTTNENGGYLYCIRKNIYIYGLNHYKHQNTDILHTNINHPTQNTASNKTFEPIQTSTVLFSFFR